MEELIKEWWFLQKKYNFILNKNKMELPLPLDQLRFNLVLRTLITAYGISGIWNFIAFVPWCNKDDEKILWYNNCSSNYSFRLISSLIFFLLWISQFKYLWLSYLTMAEIFIVIIAYLCLIIGKERYIEKNENNIKRLKKKSLEEIKNKF